MGDFFDDFFGIAKFSFSWLRNWEVWRTNLTLYFVSALILVAFGIPSVVLLMMGSIPSIVFAVLLAATGFMALLLFSYYYLAKVMFFAFDDAKLARMEHFSLSNALDFFLLYILQAAYALFSIPRPRFLLIPLAGLALFAFGLMLDSVASIFLFFLCAALFFAYVFVVVYMGLRLSQAIPLFLSGVEGKRACLDASWNLTNGRVLRVLGFSVLFAVLTSAVSQVVFIPLNFVYLFFLGISVGSFSDGAVIGAFALLVIVGISLFLLLIMLLQGLQSYFAVGVYGNLRPLSSPGGLGKAPLHLELPKIQKPLSRKPLYPSQGRGKRSKPASR